MGHKKIKDLQQAMHDLQAAYGKVQQPVELLIHFNTPDTGRIMPNQRQSEHDLKALKRDLDELKDKAKEVKEIYDHLF